MHHNPFTARYQQFPDTLPIFPLPGAIVMPGTELPLNIFEPRYPNMVSGALGTHLARTKDIGHLQRSAIGDVYRAPAGLVGKTGPLGKRFSLLRQNEVHEVRTIRRGSTVQCASAGVHPHNVVISANGVPFNNLRRVQAFTRSFPRIQHQEC
jgi:hypothetical protein